MTVHTILLVAATSCFVLAAWQDRAPTFNRFLAVGLAAFAASFIW